MLEFFHKKFRRLKIWYLLATRPDLKYIVQLAEDLAILIKYFRRFEESHNRKSTCRLAHVLVSGLTTKEFYTTEETSVGTKSEIVKSLYDTFSSAPHMLLVFRAIIYCIRYGERPYSFQTIRNRLPFFQNDRERRKAREMAESIVFDLEHNTRMKVANYFFQITYEYPIVEDVKIASRESFRNHFPIVFAAWNDVEYILPQTGSELISRYCGYPAERKPTFYLQKEGECTVLIRPVLAPTRFESQVYELDKKIGLDSGATQSEVEWTLGDPYAPRQDSWIGVDRMYEEDFWKGLLDEMLEFEGLAIMEVRRDQAWFEALD